jgi:2-dehydropantoate 2-reductase
MNQPMRFLVLGGGALGTVVAAYLARAGNGVVLFVKPAHAAAIGAQEVTLTGIAEFTTPLGITSSADGLGHFDYLIVCVKGRDTDAALAALDGLDVDAVLSLQNGVKKDDVLADHFGRDRVLGALAFVSGALVRPGHALNTAAQGIFLGELDGSLSRRAEQIASGLDRSGIPTRVVPDIVRREWDKLVLYLSLALVTSTTRLPTLTVIEDPDLGSLSVSIAREVAAVAEAEGCPLSVDAGYLATLQEWARPIKEKRMLHYMSMTQDLLAGRPTELEWTAGDIVDRATRRGQRVPAIDVLVRLLRGIERNAAPAKEAPVS